MRLRTKLILAFSGPLAILIILGLISARTITKSSHTVERIFRENYDSADACLKMKDAILVMDGTAEIFVWDGVKDEKTIAADLEFVNHLRFQQGNVTLPGEQDLTDSLTNQWNTYRVALEKFFTLSSEGTDRRQFYRNSILPQSQRVLDIAQRIIDINLNNMVSTDGQVRKEAAETNRTLLLLVLSGILLSALFVGIFWQSMVRPISRLMDSVQEIQRGNLDFFVHVHSKDEIGNLASAFNEMTSTLRRFRKMNRTKLLRSQRATISVLNALPQAIAVCNPGGGIELSNEAAVKMFALAPGKSIKDAADEKIVELFSQANLEMRPFCNKGWDWAIQKFSDGDEKFFLPEAIPIFDDEHGLIGVTMVISDVTRLRQLDEAKNGLISTVSHELKTPLTSIRLATHALLNEKLGVLNPKQTELVLAAREESDRLHRIIENLLELGRMESGGARLDLMPISAEEILLAAADEMRTAFADRGVSLSLELPADSPRVLADRLRLGIVFANLLNNALKHTPPGGRVTLSGREEGGEVLFSVEDTGEGIPQENLPHIFEKFFRVPGCEEYGTSGLGLAIVKEITEGHGSNIKVNSSPGKGARFEFALSKAESV
ncbi:Multi-sensor signal transduction histidine kinase [Syntrophobacter sp. SbD1]|nr:Multi-sensor signal transduction histidine kinase [Syntrophobacter sp. SbD1]